MSQPTRKKLIQKTPGVCGDNPRIRDTPIAVWTLIAFREKDRGAAGDEQKSNGYI